MKGTISSKEEINILFETGKKVGTASMVALIKRRQDPEGKEIIGQSGGRIAVIAGKRLGNAPQRSKAKRRIREAARLAGAPWQGYDVVLIAREGIKQAGFEMIVKDMGRITVAIHRVEEEAESRSQR